MAVVFGQATLFVTIHHGLQVVASALVLVRNRGTAGKTAFDIQAESHVRIVRIITLNQFNARQTGTILRTTCGSFRDYHNKAVFIFRVRVSRSTLVIFIVESIPGIVLSTGAGQTVAIFKIVNVSSLGRNHSCSCTHSK